MMGPLGGGVALAILLTVITGWVTVVTVAILALEYGGKR